MPAPQFVMKSSVPALSQVNPSSPTDTRWWESIDLMCRLISSAQASVVCQEQFGETGNAPDPPQRGSLASSQVMTVGSSLYFTPLSVLVRLSRCEMYALNQPLIVGSE